MASTRRYHGPGVGGRTGMRVAEDVRSISGYLEAGRRAMDTHDDTRYTYDDDVTREASTSYQRESGHILSSPRPYVSPQSKSINRDRTTVAAASPLAGSSSMAMDLEHSYAPSPQSRRSSRRETMLLSANEFASTSMSNGSDAAGVSMIDYGLEGGDAADETVTADVGGRSAFSIGLNRARQSNFSHADISRRESQGAASFSSDDYQDRQQDVMDFGGEEIPSFRVDDSASLPDAYPAENGYASGEEVDGYVDGSGSGPVEIDDTPSEAEGQGTFLAADEASREDGHQSVEEVDAVEHETNAATSSRKKKGGRTARAGTATDRGVGRGRPKELQGGAMIKERVASSRGRAGSVIDGDVRRSTRHRYAPLEYWRGERAIYGRPSLLNKEQRRSDTADADETIDENVFEDRPARAYSVPVLREIIRFTRAPNEGTFTGMTIKRKRASSHTGSGKHTAKRRTRKATADGSASSEDEVELDPTVPTRHVEDGWDDATDPQGTVWDAENDIEVERGKFAGSIETSSVASKLTTFAELRLGTFSHCLSCFASSNEASSQLAFRLRKSVWCGWVHGCGYP